MRRNPKPTIRGRLLATMALLVLVSLAIWAVVWFHNEYQAFKSESDSLREKHLQTQQELLRSQVTNVVSYLRYLESQTESRLKSSIKDRVSEACHIAENLYRQNQHTRSHAEIQKAVEEILRSIRFNSGQGYYFALRLDGVAVVFPSRPNLEGTNLLVSSGAEERSIARDIIDLALQQGEGYCQYDWTRVHGDGARSPKISYVKRFEPLGWIIGTGEYVDDVRAKLQAEALHFLASLRFGPEGYFFGSTYQGDSLFSNGRITQEEGSIWDLTDSAGVKIIQEQKKAGMQPGGGFVSYTWPRIGSSSPAPKLSYILSVPEWTWIIGAGIYLDTIEAEISQKKAMLQQRLVGGIWEGSFISLSLTVLVLLLARHLSNRIGSGIKAFSWFFEKAATESVTMDPGGMPFSEFEEIAILANHMVQDRKAAETALQESEERLRLALEGGELGTWHWDIQTDRIEINRRWAEMLGYAQDEIEPTLQSWKELLHPEDAEAVLRTLEDHLTGRVPAYETEHRLHHKSGGWIWVLDKGQVIERDGQGTPLRASGTHLDITERKRAEEALQKALHRFYTVLSSLYAGILLVQDNGRVEFVNQAFCNLFELDDSPESLRGLDASQLTERIRDVYAHPQEAVARFLAIIAQGEPVRGEEVPIRDQKTYLRDFIPIVTGEVLWDRLWHYQDITDRKRAEEQRLQLEQHVQQAQKRASLLTMAGAIAHHFNNLLFVVLGNLELALEDLPPGSTAALDVMEAENAAARAVELSRLMLTYVGQGARIKRLLDLTEMVRGLLPGIQSQLPETVVLETRLDTGCPPLFLDPVDVERILTNLVSNGCEAMGAQGGVLRVTVRSLQAHEPLAQNPAGAPVQLSGGPWVCLEVTDTGEGMTPEIQSRMFDPFFSTKFTGRGLGLAVTLGIVQACDGTIAVESAPSAGTTVRVCFLAIKLGESGEA